jgi:hypothetical protein
VQAHINSRCAQYGIPFHSFQKWSDVFRQVYFDGE